MKMQKSVIFVEKKLKIDMWKKKNIVKLEIIVTLQENIEVLRISYVILNIVYLKKIPVYFHNRSNYDYHFIIKDLAEEFKKQLTCLGNILRIYEKL